MAKRKISKKPAKREPICPSSILHILVGILALIAILFLIVIAIPEEGLSIEENKQVIEDVEIQPEENVEPLPVDIESISPETIS